MSVVQLSEAGVAPATGKVYTLGQYNFSNFCNQAGLTTYPVSKQMLMLFAAYLYTQNLANGTIKSYLAGMYYGQVVQGLGNLRIHQMPQLEYLLKGIKKLSLHSARVRLPITPQALRDLKRVWERADNKEEARLL